MKVNLGGDRLGSGAKMDVEMHGFERATFNLSHLWRSTMSPGTLVPFTKQLVTPGDTWEIDLDVDVKTHPTVGPLFGSYKVQLDIFEAPIELYQGKLHNNALNIGMNMANVKLPIYTLTMTDQNWDASNPDNCQINPSCILSYLGNRGIGRPTTTGEFSRDFNSVPYLMYVDIYKNYYANKQEEVGAVIHTERETLIQTVDEINVYTSWNTSDSVMSEAPATNNIVTNGKYFQLQIAFTGAEPKGNQIWINTDIGRFLVSDICNYTGAGGGIATWSSKLLLQSLVLFSWEYINVNDITVVEPTVWFFPLDDIDKMRNYILANTLEDAALNISDLSVLNNISPYKLLLDNADTGRTQYSFDQEGLLIKTYQSDLFNNWLSTEWIDGANGINEISRVDTSAGYFTIDALQLSRKIYDMLNRIAVAGGTYDDYLDAQYTHKRMRRVSTPIYHGGLSRELVFQEVISNAEATNEAGTQPLGTLAGRGVMSNKRKGGHVRINVNNPGYIMGIVSITPRLDYSQGNMWDVHLKSMADIHVPALDGIGFEDLISEQLAYWSTEWDGGKWLQRSVGKQPAWMNYRTNVNIIRGNFASSERFMVLDRRYEYDDTASGDIADLTTYIDPKKFNYIFADTSIDAQNFWVQISCDMTARRKLSARLIPNL